MSENETPPAPQPAPPPVKKRYQKNLRSQPFDFEFAEDDVREYTLNEIPCLAFNRWQSSVAERVRTDNNGVPTGGIKKYEGHWSSLLALSIKDEHGKAVTATTIDSWAPAMVAELFEDCLFLCSSTKAGVAEAKNG